MRMRIILNIEIFVFLFWQIQFPQAYCLTYVRFMQKTYRADQNGDVILHFDPSTQVQVNYASECQFAISHSHTNMFHFKLVEIETVWYSRLQNTVECRYNAVQ